MLVPFDYRLNSAVQLCASHDGWGSSIMGVDLREPAEDADDISQNVQPSIRF